VRGGTINSQRPIAVEANTRILLRLSGYNGHGLTYCWLAPVANDPTPKSGMHRNNQDMMVYSLSLAPLASFIAGGAGTRPEHSIGGYGAQFRFYSPAETR
jgi:hypothetical protein